MRYSRPLMSGSALDSIQNPRYLKQSVSLLSFNLFKLLFHSYLFATISPIRHIHSPPLSQHRHQDELLHLLHHQLPDHQHLCSISSLFCGWNRHRRLQRLLSTLLLLSLRHNFLGYHQSTPNDLLRWSEDPFLSQHGKPMDLPTYPLRKHPISLHSYRTMY